MTEQYRRTGKTTACFEAAVNALAEHETGCVLVLGAHPSWVRELDQRCKAAGLRDVEVRTYENFLHHSHGQRYVDVICDDFDAVPEAIVEPVRAAIEIVRR